ncbi:MAG: hypothetical protein KJP07_22045, partial [Desulfatitalea sp.]|nr:hypothetical protein [Desulfatitalea sp.]
MTLSQDNRLIRIATPLGDSALIVQSLNGTEWISQLFSFDLQLVSEQNDITFDQLAGANCTLGIRSSDGSERHINGIISEFAQTQTSDKDGLSKYQAVLSPTVLLLEQCFDCRIFQDKSTPDIIKAVLSRDS